MTDLVKLRELAEKATDGPWDTHCGTTVRAVKGDFAVPIFVSCAPVDWHKKKNLTHKVMCAAYADEVNNTAFIAAANPTTVLALLDRIEELERERDEAKAAVKEIQQDLPYVIGWNAGFDHAMEETLKLQFPTMLRKMWFGGEVQQWLEKAKAEARAASTLKGNE